MMKISRTFFFALLTWAISSTLWAGNILSVTNVSLNPPAPAAGQSVQVTWDYVDDTAFNDPRYMIVVSTFSTLQPANTAGQSIVIGDGCVPGSQVNGGCDIGNNVAAGSHTVTQTITVPSTLAPGTTYFVIIGMQDYYIGMNPGLQFQQQGFASFVAPLPSPSFSLSKRAEGTTAAPNGLILFNIDSNFVNSSGCYISDVIPANTTFVTGSPGFNYSAGSVSWYVGNVSAPITNTFWFLVSVDPGTADGTVISNSATGFSTEEGVKNSNTVTSTVAIPNLFLTKSQSSASLAAGATVTYNLDWTADGKNLQMYDSYDNISTGTSTSGSPVPWGYDNTGYTIAFAGDNGTWTIGSDAVSNHYIIASTAYFAGGGNGHYPELIRDVPGYNVCGDVIVEGDLQIPVSVNAGMDAHMVVACNPSQGITLKVGISLDTLPGHLFAQYNNNYQPGYWPTLQDNGVPFAITTGVWYTMKTEVLVSAGGGGISLITQLWPKDNPGATHSVTFTDNFDPIPACSGGWRAGWQADETSGTAWYSNLKIFGPGPIVNAGVTDIVPTGVTYLGSNVPTSSTSPLVWDVASGAFPATMYSFDTPISWWGTVACPGPTISNQFSMAALGIPSVNSNTVNLTLSSCLTTTPTDTPTPSNTPTPSPTPTDTPTPTMTNSPTFTDTPTPTDTPVNSFTPTATFTPTFTPTPTVTLTPVNTATNTPTPVGLHVWPNPFDPKYAVNGILKAYQVPPGTTMSFYTVSGELVITTGEINGMIAWDGHNKLGAKVSTGTYYYVIQNNDTVLLTGKVLVLMDS